MKPFGGGHVVVEKGRVVDDGDFSTANNDPVLLRAYAIWREGELVAGRVPPARSAKADGRLPWLLTRPELAALDFNEFPAGKYRIQLWGGVGTNPDWYEIGSSNPADNGATDVVIATDFTIGPGPLPEPNDAELAFSHFIMSTFGSRAYSAWKAANPGEAQRMKTGDYNPTHYATRFGKFLAHLHLAAQ